MRRSSAILFYHLGVLASADRLTLAPELHGELVSQRRSGTTAFYHGDALGSVRNLTSSAQTVTDTRDYQTFGLTNASSGTSWNRLWWVGKLGYYWQPDTADYWLRARVYRPLVGRFVSRDPARAEISPYRWPGNSPVMLVDPSGRQGCGPRQASQGASGSGTPYAGTGKGGGGGQGIGPAKMRVRCPDLEGTCCEVVRPGLRWWSLPQGIAHKNWETASCSCGETLPNCSVDFHKLVAPPGQKPVHHTMTSPGKCVPCKGGGGGGGNGDGGKKRLCGPDVTAQVVDVVDRIRAAFRSWSPQQRYDACHSFIGYNHLYAWDTFELHRRNRWIDNPPYHPPCAEPTGTDPQHCGRTVEIDGQCFYSGTANYVTLGTMWKERYLDGQHWFKVWPYSEWTLRRLIWAYKGDITFFGYTLRRGAANWKKCVEWAVAGYRDWRPTPGPSTGPRTPSGDRPSCTPAYPAPYQGRRSTVYWDPVGVLP